MKRVQALLGFALLAAVPGGLAAQAGTGTFLVPDNRTAVSRVGTRGANFLEIGVGARGLAVGGAYAGMARGATAMYWNPALVGATDGFVGAFSRAALYEDLDITHDFAGVALPAFGGGLGVSYIRLNSGDIPRTTEFDPAGTLNEFGDVFSWNSTAVGLHYGRRLTDRLMVGFGAKVVSEGIDQANTSWWGIDVGTSFNTGLYGLQIAGAVLNVGPASRAEGGLITRRVADVDVFPVAVPVRYNTVAYQLPTVFRFGVVSTLTGTADALLSPAGPVSWRLALDFSDAIDTDLQMSLGTEFNFRDFAFVRVGKRWMNEANADFRSFSHGLSFGGGLMVPLVGRRLAFDYAYVNMGDLQNVQVFSFEIGQ